MFDDSNHATLNIALECLLSADDGLKDEAPDDDDDDDEYNASSRYSSDTFSESEHPPSRAGGPVNYWSQSATTTLLQMRDDGHSWKDIEVVFPERTPPAAIRAHWVRQIVGILSSDMVHGLTKRRRNLSVLTIQDPIVPLYILSFYRYSYQ